MKPKMDRSAMAGSLLEQPETAAARAQRRERNEQRRHRTDRKVRRAAARKQVRAWRADDATGDPALAGTDAPAGRSRARREAEAVFSEPVEVHEVVAPQFGFPGDDDGGRE